MDVATYKKLFSEDDAVGWEAIDKSLEALYPHQEPEHYAPNLPASLGGDSYLDGISIYHSEYKSHIFISLLMVFPSCIIMKKPQGAIIVGLVSNLPFA